MAPHQLPGKRLFPVRRIILSMIPEAGLIAQRADCEVYETNDIGSQIRH